MKQKLFTAGIFAIIGFIATFTAFMPIATAQSITIGAISASSFCGGDSISVSFSVTGYWLHKNAFTLQLSDASGSFSVNFTNLGSIKDTLPGTFTIGDTIPGNLEGSSHYRFRIMGALPYTTSADNGSDIAIGQKPRFEYNLSPYQTGVGNPLLVGFNGDFGPDTIYWDFGADATPATAAGVDLRFDTITYAKAGIKTVTVRAVSPSGCTATTSFPVHVYDCAAPAIPHYAAVIDTDGRYYSDSATTALWVNPGVSVTLYYNADTIFAESGSTINCTSCSNTIYLKPGAAVVGMNYGVTFYASGANPGSGGLRISCPSLNFDYTDAPPNAAMPPADVNMPVASSVITLAPNPTNGTISVDGLPSNARDISIENVLGESVMQLRNSGMPQLSIDLSSLPHGTYYLRFASGGAVVTKKIVRR